MVLDPTTGEMVTAPERTLTLGYKGMLNSWDPYSGWPDPPVMGVLEKLAIANWGIDRDEWDLKSPNTYPPAITGRLAESWETPDDTTFVFHIRDGVRWHNKAPMNGRLLTAQDIEFNFQHGWSGRLRRRRTIPLYGRFQPPCRAHRLLRPTIRRS